MRKIAGDTHGLVPERVRFIRIANSILTLVQFRHVCVLSTIMQITLPSDLSPAELTAELSRLARCEREATAALIVHLAEFDRRRLYEGAGYPSLFKYCMAVLHLSEDAVYNRIEVARAARRYPVILEMLASGALSPTTARLLASHLTPENQEALLAAAAGKGKQAVEELLAHRFPRPDVVARVRKVPSRAVALPQELAPLVPTPNACGLVAGRELLTDGEGVGSAPDAPVVTAARLAVPRPVSPSARAGALRDPLHRERGDARQATSRPGPARARTPQR